MSGRPRSTVITVGSCRWAASTPAVPVAASCTSNPDCPSSATMRPRMSSSSSTTTATRRSMLRYPHVLSLCPHYREEITTRQKKVSPASETYHDRRRHPLPHRRARRGTALRPLLPAASGAAVPAAADRLRRAGDARRAAVRTVGGHRRPAPRRGPGRDPRPHARGLADPLDAVPADRLLDDPAAGLRGDRPVLDRGPAHARRHEHARGLPGGLAGLVRDPPGARRGAGIPRQRRGDLVGVPARVGPVRDAADGSLAAATDARPLP